MDLESLSTQLDKICRVCLKICDWNKKSRSVFGELKKQEILDDNLFFVYEILCSITSIEVTKGDGYPTLICLNCMGQANIAYKFKKQYERSQQVILECINQKAKVPETIKDKNDTEVEEAAHISLENDVIEEVVENISNTRLDNNSSINVIKFEPCLTTDIFNLSEVEAENVNLETIFDHFNPHSSEIEDAPKIKNISMVDENKIARKCLECDYVFQTAYAFHNHSCNREDLDRKLCPICGKSISKSHYNKHLYMHSGRRDYICQICNKAYNASGSLKFHMAKHTGEKPYLCSLCGKRFIQPTALKYHMRFHNNERRYKCNFCEKSFVMQCHLVVHERVHKGVKPFTCEICGKGFTRKVELKAHAYAHTGEKPFRCRFCNKAFVRKTHLTLHEMVHSGNRPHECKICGKGFIQKQPLRMHLRVHEQEGYTVAEVRDEEDQKEEYQDNEDYDEIKEFL